MKLKVLVAVMSFGMFFFTSCTDTVKETTVIRESETENKEGILERSAKKIDSEVNKEIDKKIEEIGDNK